MASREEKLGVSREYLLFHFAYKDGQLIRKKDGVGDVRNDWGKGKNGYKKVNIGRKPFSVHRLIWVMHNGYIPDGSVIDHIDRDRVNNRIENLRVVSRHENCKNREAPFSGHAGIIWHKKDRAWHARISINKKQTHLGAYKNIDDAIRALRGTSLALKTAGAVR